MARDETLCPLCGSAMRELKCKARCTNAKCNFFLDCTDG